ncbi:molybdopterin-guanine dinucleotide biosynthesis protein B [Liquorilactobacillus satsumensis]|uniref:molybdopterin-guanine dinucleotide biosynthesis protein B n=1 Tax=Liquorilactobacillus satsumensis TaxID=259059 RepID=UPI0039E808E5
MVATIQIIGYKKSGKTAVIIALIKALKKEGFQIGVFKHDHLQATMDQINTDTDDFSQNGAQTVGLQSEAGLFIHQTPPCPIDPAVIIDGYFKSCNLVILEGFKAADYPKLVMLRSSDSKDNFDNCTNIINYASLTAHKAVSLVGIAAIIDWLTNYIKKSGF